MTVERENSFKRLCRGGRGQMEGGGHSLRLQNCTVPGGGEVPGVLGQPRVQLAQENQTEDEVLDGLPTSPSVNAECKLMPKGVLASNSM